MWDGRILEEPSKFVFKKAFSLFHKVFEKFHAKVATMKILNRQSSIYEPVFNKLLIYVTSTCNWAVAISANSRNSKF